MASNSNDSSVFGLDRVEGEQLVCRLIQASVPVDRMHDHELDNLAGSLRIINDRLPDLVGRYVMLQVFWDRIETEIALRTVEANVDALAS